MHLFTLKTSQIELCFKFDENFKETARVDLHTPKMLIIQFHKSSWRENACHTIFIHLPKMGVKRYKVTSAAV